MIPNIQGPFNRIKYVPINLNSPEQIKKYLLSLGWKPQSFNYKKDGKRLIRNESGKLIKTSPKMPKGDKEFELLEKDLSKSGNPEQIKIGKLIARRYILRHRKSILINDDDPNKGWLGLVRPDGRLGAQCIAQATNTGRARHKVVVNVPKAKKKIPFGIELRSCITVPNDKIMVGSDAKGLEARIEAHYCYPFTGGKEYAKELLEGNIHEKNMLFFGIDDYDLAKNGKYCLSYGGQAQKLADTLELPLKRGKESFEEFWEGNTALKECRDNLTEFYIKNGFIIGLDGRKIFIRSKHSIVNACFQSGGSIVVKTAMCFLFNSWLIKKDIDAKLLLFQHDEFQIEINPKHKEEYIKLADKSFKIAGKFYNLNVPLEGDSKAGKNWADTH